MKHPPDMNFHVQKMVDFNLSCTSTKDLSKVFYILNLFSVGVFFLNPVADLQKVPTDFIVNKKYFLCPNYVQSTSYLCFWLSFQLMQFFKHPCNSNIKRQINDNDCWHNTWASPPVFKHHNLSPFIQIVLELLLPTHY